MSLNPLWGSAQLLNIIVSAVQTWRDFFYTKPAAKVQGESSCAARHTPQEQPPTSSALLLLPAPSLAPVPSDGTFRALEVLHASPSVPRWPVILAVLGLSGGPAHHNGFGCSRIIFFIGNIAMI